MYLRQLHLINFKNYSEANLQFDPKINVLVGPNGSGKTNLLDAVYYLSFTKSAFQPSDPSNIAKGSDHFLIKGEFERDNRTHDVMCAIQVNQRKSVREDGLEYQKFSEHIGKYPVVFVSPDDTEIVRGGGEIRRKLFDGILSQIDKDYLEHLLNYNHALKQRNGLLRLFHQSQQTDLMALESYDHVLNLHGTPIHNKRKAFVSHFKEVFDQYFSFLVSEREKTDLQYVSQLENVSVEKGLKESRKKDLTLQRTTFGIHRDDYIFTLQEMELKRAGSQGQQKSFVIALRLAQWQVIAEAKGFKPILLLDDIFDKLDDFRIARLLELIEGRFGQLFITDARPDRTQELLRRKGAEVTVFNVENGHIKKS